MTEFTYRLHPVGPFTIGRVMVPLQPDGARSLELADELASSAPDELVIFVYGPSSIDADGNEVEAGTVPPFVRVDLLFQGDADTLARLVEPLLALAGVRYVATPGTYLDVQEGELLPFGLRNYWKGHFVRALDGPTIEATVDAMTTVPGAFYPAPGGDHRAGPPGARGRGGIRPAGRELERLGARDLGDPRTTTRTSGGSAGSWTGSGRPR